MRKWTEMIAPKLVHQQLGAYHGEWMPEMDRCWMSDDGYSVMSRLIDTKTPLGKVEHVTIQRRDQFSGDGSGEIPWKVKQEIKNELFGEKRTAIEVFPASDRLVDVMDVYHLWVICDKNFRLPFGIHSKDNKGRTINRGLSINMNNLKEREASMREVMR